jgi:two-component system CheB/CheR fusion protein
MQRRVMATLHYSLAPEGLLLLGQSETVGASSEYFTVVNRQHKIYAKRAQTSPALADRKPPVPSRTTATPAVRGPRETIRRSDVERESQRLLLSRYAPVSVLVDERDEVIHFRGDTAPYLGHAQGTASFQLSKLARKTLWPELRRLLQDARAANEPQRKAGLLFRHQGRTRRLALEAIPIPVPGSPDRCYLLIFDEGTRRREPAGAQVVRSATAERRQVAQLEQELQALEYYQAAMQEEQETANDDLQSANEEIVSSNEELQSINEEMETAKEELQSNNE